MNSTTTQRWAKDPTKPLVIKRPSDQQRDEAEPHRAASLVRAVAKRQRRGGPSANDAQHVTADGRHRGWQRGETPRR